MSAPRFFAASFLDEVRGQTPLRTLVANRVRLKRSGKDWKGLCPFHKEKTPSFTVYDDGHYHCFGCGETGDCFAYVMKLEGETFQEAVLRLASQAGIPLPADDVGASAQRPHRGGHTNGNAKPDEWQPILPVPASAPKPTDEMLRCDMLHEYWDAEDRLLFYVRRHEATGDQRKQFYPLTYGLLQGRLGWHRKAPLSPRPLYRLNALSHADAAAVVLLCEGEKACDQAQMHFPDMVAMSWMGGIASVQQVDWAPLADREVIVFPDADDVGRKAAAQIATLLPRARILDTTGLPEGFDAADLHCDDPEVWLKARLPHEMPRVQWRDVRLSSWAGRQLPERRWIVPEWIPVEQVTGLYGVGGINKTDFLIQLMMCFSRGLPFIGHRLEQPAPAYGLFVEDSEAEIVRRATRIAREYSLSLADFPDFHFASLVGFAETEFVTFDGPKLLIAPALMRFDQAIVQHHARLCVLDTVPDFFGGNEIARREVSQFIRVLDAISMQRGCGLVFTAHPSVRGQESGAFDSGSTGWTGKVRARLSLHDPGPDDEDEDEKKERSRIRLPPPSTNRRILIRQKSNYAPQGVALKLICRDGVFTPDALDPEQAETRGPTRNAAAEAKFIELLPKAEAAISYVSYSALSMGHYAPTVFAVRQDCGGFSKAEFVRAMQRLLEAGRLRVAPIGSPSSRQHKLVIVP